MLDTAMASLRFAASTLFGRRFSQRSLDHLYRAAIETQREFGGLGSDASPLLAGPGWDEEARRFFQGRRFRQQAVRAGRETEYYESLFARLGLDPSRIGSDDITGIPVTPKDALRDDPEAFVRRRADVGVRATTTGTTGWPTSVYFSHQEIGAMRTLSALGFLTEGLISSDDLVQVSISTRNTLGVLGVSAAATGVGAGLHVAGLVEPERTLQLLSEHHHLAGKKPRVSVMSTYPSYLGELVEHGLRLGYTPDDFGLERVLAASEIVTEGLKRRARELFGPIEVVQSYAMTEIAPMGANVCDQSHLHFEPSVGLAEVVSLEHGGTAADGEVGTVVATPFAPFRESTVLLRYDTEDVVRAIDGTLTCRLASLPATSHLLGRKRSSVRHDEGWTFTRDVAEALEDLEDVPLPARFGFWAVPGGVAVEVVVRSVTGEARRRVGDALGRKGVPLRELRLVDDGGDLHRPVPLRCDLREGAPRPIPQFATGAPVSEGAGPELLEARGA
jgi:phenylacetate-CoA ligase